MHVCSASEIVFRGRAWPYNEDSWGNASRLQKVCLFIDVKYDLSGLQCLKINKAVWSIWLWIISSVCFVSDDCLLGLLEEVVMSESKEHTMSRVCPAQTCLELAFWGRAVSKDCGLPIAISPVPILAPHTELVLNAYSMNMLWLLFRMTEWMTQNWKLNRLLSGVWT